MRATLIVARKEFLDCFRSRWLVSGSLIFAILSLAVFFGTAAIGGTLSFQPLATVINSLLSLTVFVLPLLVLMLGYDAFVGEAESGTLLLMLTYPLTRTEWLLGKACGQAASLACVLVLGFAALPIVQLLLAVPYSMGELMEALVKLAATGWLLALVFLFLSYWVSLIVRHKAQALAALLVLWFVMVLLYDLAILVVSVAAADVFGRETLTLMMLANPASVFRLMNQMAGAGDAVLVRPDMALMTGILIAWIVVLFGLCRWVLVRRRL